jgi:hypothetical protein
MQYTVLFQLYLALLNLQVILNGQIHALFYGQVPRAVLGITVIMKYQGEKKNPAAVPLHRFII